MIFFSCGSTSERINSNKHFGYNCPIETKVAFLYTFILDVFPFTASNVQFYRVEPKVLRKSKQLRIGESRCATKKRGTAGSKLPHAKGQFDQTQIKTTHRSWIVTDVSYLDKKRRRASDVFGGKELNFFFTKYDNRRSF